jgi:glycosyltransferase involved in cell wall biosynthesis
VKPIAYVTTTFPTFAAFIENEVWRLHRRGVPIRVYTLRPVHPHYQPEHAPLLALTRWVGFPLSPAALGALLMWLVRKPHVLIPGVLRMLWASRRSGYALAGHLGYLPAAARVAWLIEREGIGRVHGAWAHFPASVAWLASRLTGARFSMAGHAGSDLYRTQAFLAEKARSADFVATCVRGNGEMLRALAGPGARIEWIYHGVDRSRFDGTGRARDPEPLLVAVGRLAPTKGFDLAVRALAELKRRGVAPRLMFVGDGPERAALETLAREGGVAAQVSFLGFMPQTEVLPLYRKAWLLVSPSRVLANGHRDGIPNVIVEALAMGLPCVGTRAAGLEEAITPGVTGELVPPEDPIALAAALERLLRDPAEIDRLSANARGRVVEAFDADRNFERLWKLFEDGDTAPARIAPAAAGAAR